VTADMVVLMNMIRMIVPMLLSFFVIVIAIACHCGLLVTSMIQ